MSLKFAKIASFTAIAAAAGLSLWARTQLPDVPIASHFDASGHVDGTMPRDVALVVGPITALIMAAVMLWVIPAIMPKKAGLARSSQACSASVIAITLFICLIHAGLVALALHAPVDVPRTALAGVGLLFIVIGNYLPKTRFNYVMGIRNPWTLSDETVWDRTHRLTGPLFMILGLLVIADAVLVPFPLAHIVMIAAVLMVVLAGNIYSYLIARRLGMV